MDQLRAHRSRTPNPISFCILSCEFSIATFWSPTMPHVLFPDLERTDTILLLEPPSQAYPDVSVQFVEDSGRIDCSVVTGPPSYQGVDGLEFVQVIIIECLFLGHFLNLLHGPLQALLCRLHKHPDDLAIGRFITAEDVISQEIEAVNDVSDRGFFFREFQSQFLLKETFAFLFDFLGLGLCSTYDDDPIVGIAKHLRCSLVFAFARCPLPACIAGFLYRAIWGSIAIGIPLIEPMQIDVCKQGRGYAALRRAFLAGSQFP